MEFETGDLVSLVSQARRIFGHKRGIIVGKGPFPSSYRVFWFSQSFIAIVSTKDIVKEEA